MDINLNTIRILEIQQNKLKVNKAGQYYMKMPQKPKYTAFLKPSLDVLEFRRIAAQFKKMTGIPLIINKGGVDYTDAFINVVLDKSTSKELYEEGFFVLEGERVRRYVEYKRSGNAAKNGKHLFIRSKDLHEMMMEWTWMGRPPAYDKINMSYVERKAYEALVNSAIRDAVVIDPDGILVLDDIENHFKTNAAMVGVNGKNEGTITRALMECKNMVTDGECLLDDSIFGKRDSGMMLLRNFFFKSCAFRTDIQGFYREVFKENYDTAVIEDKWGYPMPVKDIRMIVTSSSFKLFKFNDYLVKEQPYWEFMERTGSELTEQGDFFQQSGFNVYQEWKEHVRKNDCIFGVVKFEEEHKDDRRFTYQMINSMDLSKEEVNKLLDYDIRTYVRLRTDDEEYEKYVKGRGETDDFLAEMVEKNPDFRQTRAYKDKKYKYLTSYLQKLYEGKISINANYRTLCSMPWELLSYSVHQDISKIKQILKKGEVCILDIPEGEELVLCRNPHTCASNVVYARNVIPEEIKKWFRFERKAHTCNIVVLSPWEWDVMAALNGADFDSDEALCIREPIVVNCAKRMLKDDMIASVPHEKTEDFTKNGKILTGINDYESQRNTDMLLYSNNIGRISNYVQALNSYFWQIRRNGAGSCFVDNSDSLYDDIQIMSVLIGIEIDKAKHAYTVNARQLARRLLSKHIDYTEQRPLFMRFIDGTDMSKISQLAYQDNWLDCPMDYVAKRIYYLNETEPELKNLPQIPTLPMISLFDVEDYKGCDANKVNAVLGKMEECISKIKSLNINKESMDWEDRERLKKETLDETYTLMRKNKIKVKDLKRILYIILFYDVTDRIKIKQNKDGFLTALAVNNAEAIELVIEQKEYPKKQVNYKKCKGLFESYLNAKPKSDEAIRAFGMTMKKEKNIANIEYMLSELDKKREYPTTKYEVLTSLTMLHKVWPDIFEECLVKKDKNAKI